MNGKLIRPCVFCCLQRVTVKPLTCVHPTFKPEMPHTRQSNSLVNQLKAKFFPEESLKPPIEDGQAVRESKSARNAEQFEQTSFHEDYLPPADLEQTLNSLYEEHLDSWNNQDPFGGHPLSKFRFLAFCSTKLGRRVHSTSIDSIQSMDHLIDFYSQPEYRSTPLHRMKKSSLKPSNLVIFEDSLTDDEMTRRGHLWDRWIIE